MKRVKGLLGVKYVSNTIVEASVKKVSQSGKY
jgi:hypothetical protein